LGRKSFGLFLKTSNQPEFPVYSRAGMRFPCACLVFAHVNETDFVDMRECRFGRESGIWRHKGSTLLAVCAKKVFGVSLLSRSLVRLSFS
jgi:hypothetical protein